MQKRASELTLEDFDHAAVWVSIDGDLVEARADVDEICAEHDPTWVRFNAKLADDTPVRGVARGHCTPATLTEHTFFIGDRRLPLSLDSHDDKTVAAAEFARAIDRTIAQVFPIFIRAEIKAQSTADTISQELDVTGPAE